MGLGQNTGLFLHVFYAVYAVVLCLSVRLSVCVCHTPVLYENG